MLSAAKLSLDFNCRNMHIPLPLQTNDTQCNEGFHTSEKPKLDNASVMHKQSHRLKFRYLVFYETFSKTYQKRHGKIY